MNVAKTLVPLFFLTSSIFAGPVITSVTPREGPVTGGTTVQIHGTGFSNNCVTCSPPFGDPEVLFGSRQALDVRYVSPNLLEAVTPPNIPGDVSVTVQQADGSDPNHSTLQNAFTYTGDVLEGYEPLLFPIFQPPVPGRHGSEFRTTAHIWNKHLNAPVVLYGVDTTCSLAGPPIDPTQPYAVQARDNFETRLYPECSDTIGRILWVPKGDRSIVASLRVYETSKQSENHGVEIPVARLEDFDDESIALLGVPRDPKFRLKLRVYSFGTTAANFVNVSFNGRGVQLPLRRGATMFEPHYAEWDDFAAIPTVPQLPGETMTVLVDVPRDTGGVHIPGTPIWAFITVTNNETQHITTITPQQ